MTFQISKIRVFAIALCLMASISINAQEVSQMQSLIEQSLSKIQQPTPEAYLNCIAELERIDAMFPDSIQPKQQMVLQSLFFSVMNPQTEQTNRLITQAEQTINQIEQMKGADKSDVYTLRGFLYMVRIVQDPAQNGQRYYLDVMQNYEKALKLNPNNQLARELQEKFFEGMKQATGGMN
ncbi:MAG: hypothetical protein IKX36_00670 [Prevotella sp.]|nr:hypothetical protein [Prevotella sp.]